MILKHFPLMKVDVKKQQVTFYLGILIIFIIDIIKIFINI